MLSQMLSGIPMVQKHTFHQCSCCWLLAIQPPILDDLPY